MKSNIIGGLAISTLLIAGPLTSALAADMAVKAPPPPVAAPTYSWTGFYVGGNVGYSWGSPNSDYVFTDGSFAQTFAHSNALHFTGAIGGAQVGYNWQAPNLWVLGVEADWQGSSEKAGLGYNDPYAFDFFPVFPLDIAGVATTNYDAKILWIGTVRGRIGYAWDRLLIYATGGLAYGDVKISGTSNDAGGGIFFVPGYTYSGTSSFDVSRVNTGWTAGGGIEGALSNNWSWKVEYLYVNLGSLNFSGPGPFPADSEVVAVQAKFTDNIVRAGLNFRFH
jgi:outer membrane immunogenic protein